MKKIRLYSIMAGWVFGLVILGVLLSSQVAMEKLGTVTNGGALRDSRQQHSRIDKGERMKQKARPLIAKQGKDCVYRHFVNLCSES